MTSYGSAWSVLLGHMLQQPSVKTRIENVVVLQQRSRSCATVMNVVVT